MSSEQERTVLKNEPGHVCSVRHAWALDNFLRRWAHNPDRMFGPWVRPGMAVLDVGCGPGFASIGLARLVGPTGRVTAVDLQPEMLEMLRIKADGLGLADRIDPVSCGPENIAVAGPFDFAVAFYMVHETPDPRLFLRQLRAVMKPGGAFFVAEPKFHVGKKAMAQTLAAAQEAGFELEATPRLFVSRTAVFRAL